MPHFFKDTSHRPGSKEFIGTVLQLQNTAPVGEGSCVDLIKTYCPTLSGKTTTTWRPGKRLIDMTPEELASLMPGTVIATFVDGKFPQHNSGQHAAFYLRRSGMANNRVTEIVIMDQFRIYDGSPARLVQSRKIWVREKQQVLPNGQPNYSNDLRFFYVVE
jgi:hypothetical protein